MIGSKEDGPRAGEFDVGLFVQIGFGTGLDVGAGGLVGLNDNADGRSTTASFPGVPDPVPVIDLVSFNVELSPTSNSRIGESVVVGPGFGAGSISDSISVDVTVLEAVDFVSDLFSFNPDPTGGASGGFVLYPSKQNLNLTTSVYDK